MGKIIAAFLGATLGLWQPGRAAAADPIPFFTPDPKPVMYGPPLPDPDVPTCAANDRACLEAHDAAALSAALAANDDDHCKDSRTPAACRAAYEMITGNVGMKADPILDDPCSWVVLVDRGIATIESKRTGTRRRYADRGWKPLTFLGKCDLSKLASRRGDAVELPTPLPTWVVRRTASGGPGHLPRPRPAATPPGPVGQAASVIAPPASSTETPLLQGSPLPARDANGSAATVTVFEPVSTTKP